MTHFKTLLSLVLSGIFLSLSNLSAQNISFSPPTVLSDLQDADGGDLDLGDIDGDGDLDLVIIGNSPSEGIETSLYLNDGTGFFTAVANDGLIDNTNGDVRFVDLDNDGDLDLVISAAISSYASSSVYMNDGTGQFTLNENAGLRPSKAGAIDIADVDDDGDADIIISGLDFQFINGSVLEENFTTLFLNDGTGEFIESTSNFEALEAPAIAFIDIDNDNDSDLILAGQIDSEEGAMIVYTNNGEGEFTALADNDFDQVLSPVLSVADSDNDGDEDVLLTGILADGSSSIVTLHYLNDGLGNFELNPGVSGLPGVGLASISDFADFDNDGDQDIILIGLSPDIIGEIYENTGDNLYMLADTMYGSYLTNVTTGDIDGDGFDDFLVTGSNFDPLYPSSRSTRVFFNNGESVGFAELSLDPITVFPNPTNGILNISTTKPIQELRVFDLLGSLVLSKANLNSTTQIDLSELNSGVYLVEIRTESGVKGVRIVRE